MAGLAGMSIQTGECPSRQRRPHHPEPNESLPLRTIVMTVVETLTFVELKKAVYGGVIGVESRETDECDELALVGIRKEKTR